MGYSISTKFKSEKSCAKMLDFLNNNKKLVTEILATDSMDDKVFEGPDLPYAPQFKSKVVLGFHGTKISFSKWAMCAWMSMKEGAISEDEKYLYYDEEKHFIYVNKSKGMEGLNVDERGIYQGEKEIIGNLNIFDLIHPNMLQTQELMAELNQRYEIVLSQEFLNLSLSKPKKTVAASKSLKSKI